MSDNQNRYQKLFEIFKDLASNPDLKSTLNQIVTSATDLTNGEEASILLFDEQKNELFFASATNASSIGKFQNLKIPKESIAGWSAMHHEAVYVPDVHHDERFFPGVEKRLNFVTQSIVAVPMLFHDQLIGVLEVINKKENSFTTDDLEILQALSAQAAIAIENSRLSIQADLISELVHEIRTPLASLGTISYLLSRPDLPDNQREKLVQTIQSETQRLNEMTTAFLDISRLETGKIILDLSKFSLTNLMEECIKIISPRAEEAQIKIQSNFENSPVEIEADRGKIKQVFLNLLNNAVIYNKTDGNISVFIKENNHQIIISIQDSGVGIPEDAIDQIFTKFFRAPNAEKKTTGTGLGLSICKQIVELHHGSIEVKSKLDQGSTFTIELPASIITD